MTNTSPMKYRLLLFLFAEDKTEIISNLTGQTFSEKGNLGLKTRYATLYVSLGIRSKFKEQLVPRHRTMEHFILQASNWVKT